MDPFVVPALATPAQMIEALPEAPSGPRRHDRLQGVNDHVILEKARGRRPVVRRPRQSDGATRALHRELMLGGEESDGLLLRGRRHNFRASTSLIAAFSRASSAYSR